MDIFFEIAHRGYSDKYKDNTLEAFQASIDSHFDMIEFDIQMTNDNIIIIHHDIIIDDIIISDTNYHTIKEKNNDILTLEDFFKHIDISIIKIYIDIKGTHTNICLHLIEILSFVQSKNNIFIGCFNMNILEKLYSLNPSFHYGMITANAFNKEHLDFLHTKVSLSFVCFEWSLLESDIIEYLQSNGILVFAFTNKNIYTLRYMNKFNLNGIVSNLKIR